MGADLVAKVTLTSDGSGVVGESQKVSGALDQVARSADNAGAAGARMGAGFGAGTAAMDTQAASAARLAASVSANDNLQAAEIVRLQQRAQAAGAVTGKIDALSAAQAEY